MTLTGDKGSYRHAQVEKWRKQFPLLGFNFGQLQVPELLEELQKLDIDITTFKGKKPLKADYVYFIERHFAFLRVFENKAPDHYLLPNFNPSKQLNSTLRQILTQHGYRYLEDGTTTFSAKNADLAKFFADNIDDMRAQRGFELAATAGPELQTFFQDMENMDISADNGRGPHDTPIPVNKVLSRPLASAVNPVPIKASSSAQSSIPQPPKGSTTQNFTPALQRQLFGVPWNPSNPGYGSTADPSVFANYQGQATRPLSSAAPFAGPSSASAARTTTSGSHVTPKPFMSAKAAGKFPATSESHTTKPFMSAKAAGKLPATSAWQNSSASAVKNEASKHAGSASAETPHTPTRTLNAHKQAKLAKLVEDSAVDAIEALREDRIVGALLAFRGLQETFEDAADLIVDTQCPPVITSARRPTPRTIEKLVFQVEISCQAVIELLHANELLKCVGTITELNRDLEGEL